MNTTNTMVVSTIIVEVLLRHYLSLCHTFCGRCAILFFVSAYFHFHNTVMIACLADWLNSNERSYISYCKYKHVHSSESTAKTALLVAGGGASISVFAASSNEPHIKAARRAARLGQTAILILYDYQSAEFLSKYMFSSRSHSRSAALNDNYDNNTSDNINRKELLAQ